MGGINAMKTAFMNLVKMVADYFIHYLIVQF